MASAARRGASRCSALSDNALRPALGLARVAQAFGVAAAIGRDIIFCYSANRCQVSGEGSTARGSVKES